MYLVLSIMFKGRYHFVWSPSAHSLVHNGLERI